ncbi:MAG TPA: glycoside hydrolase family 27 protein, partial [Opitutus sp.]|nr:glycoside hydrolase family 27 protein [Opitutus sp.]
MSLFNAILLSAAMLSPLPASDSDVSGTWRIDLPRSGGVSVRTYLVLQPEGSELKGKVVINSAADLPLRKARWDGTEATFGIDWNASYRLRRDGEHLRVVIDYNGKRTEEALATRVPESEVTPPSPLPLPAVTSLPDNGLARTPPMGWNSWNHFADRVDDRIVREAADALVATGLAAAGYVYINIDDCWEGARDTGGNLVPNSKFPDMKALADYVHSRGLKLGLYTSPGPVTCGGYVGSHGYEEQDARAFAAWGIDYLKYDW